MGGISRKGAEIEKMSTRRGRGRLDQEVYLKTSRKATDISRQKGRRAQEVYLGTSRKATDRV